MTPAPFFRAWVSSIRMNDRVVARILGNSPWLLVHAVRLRYGKMRFIWLKYFDFVLYSAQGSLCKRMGRGRL